MEPVGCVQQGSDRSGTVPCAAPPPMRMAHTWPCARRGCRCSRAQRPCKPRTRLPQPVAGGRELPTCKQIAQSQGCVHEAGDTLSRVASPCEQGTVHREQGTVHCIQHRGYAQQAGNLASPWCCCSPSQRPGGVGGTSPIRHPLLALELGLLRLEGCMQVGRRDSPVLLHLQSCTTIGYPQDFTVPAVPYFEGRGQRPAEYSSRALQRTAAANGNACADLETLADRSARAASPVGGSPLCRVGALLQARAAHFQGAHPC